MPKIATTTMIPQSLSMSMSMLLLVQLLLLSIASRSTLGNPVSNPEIATKSGKTFNGNEKQQQDAHLNALTVYATNYDTIANAENAAQTEHFRPSYKLPQMETNFTPLTSHPSPSSPSAVSGPATPVIMQYLPQSMHENGVQYLQLIPTRPLLVPISQFLTNPAQQQIVSYQPYQQAGAPTLMDYGGGGRPSTLLTALPATAAAPEPQQPAAMVDITTSSLNYALPSYASNLQPYRPNFRTNREIKPKQLLSTMTLNLNEYLPGPQDPVTFTRGRP